MESKKKTVYNMKYFSFIIGFKDSSRKNWIELDYKLPALDCVSAISLHYWSESIYTHRHKHNQFLKKNFTLPDRSIIDLTYRIVIEYEKKFTPQKGRTTHYYKLIKKHHTLDFITKFPANILAKN